MPLRDRHRQHDAGQRYYASNSETIKARARRFTKKHRLLLREHVRRAKEVPCPDCGESYPHYAMEFDHVRGKKRANIADLVRSSVSFAVLIREIAKCDIVCANCHRERTWQRKPLENGHPEEVAEDMTLF